MPVGEKTKYEEVSKINGSSVMGHFLGRCLYGVICPLGGNSNKYKLVQRFVGTDPKKYILVTWFGETEAKCAERHRSCSDGVVRKLSKASSRFMPKRMWKIGDRIWKNS